MKRKLMSCLLACALALYGPLPAYGEYAAAPLGEGAGSSMAAEMTDGGSRIIDIHGMFNADSIVTTEGTYSGDCQYLINGGDVGTYHKGWNSGDYQRDDNGEFAKDSNGSYKNEEYESFQGWLPEGGDTLRLNVRKATSHETSPDGKTNGDKKYLIWSLTGETVDICVPRAGLATGVHDAVRITADDGADGVTIPLTGEPARFLDVALNSAYGPRLMADVEYADGTHHVTERQLYTNSATSVLGGSWQEKSVMMNYYENDAVVEGGVAAFAPARIIKCEDGALKLDGSSRAIAVDRVTLDPTKSPVSVRLYNTRSLPVDVYAITLETLTNAELTAAIEAALARAQCQQVKLIPR